MLKRLLNACGLATFSQFRELERDWFDNSRLDRKTIQGLLTHNEEMKEYLEEKFRGLVCEGELEMVSDNVECVEGRYTKLDDRLTDLESVEVICENGFDIDDYFDIHNYESEIEEMISGCVPEIKELVTVEMVEEKIDEAITKFAESRMTVEDSLERIANLVIEKIGGAILGLIHEAPEPKPEPKQVYVDPVLRQLTEALEDKN